MWVTAIYPSTDPSTDTSFSQAVIWDTIINSQSQSNPFNPLRYVTESPTAKMASKPKRLTRREESKSEPGILRLKNSKPKYQITDISGIISERQNVTLEVGWNVQPWVGALAWTMSDGQKLLRWKGVKGGRSPGFRMPALKSKSAPSETVIGTSGTPNAAEASAVV